MERELASAQVTHSQSFQGIGTATLNKQQELGSVLRGKKAYKVGDHQRVRILGELKNKEGEECE